MPSRNRDLKRHGALPSKHCIVCGRAFTWRKKWERVWTEVKYCSDACRRGTPRGKAR